MTMQTDGWSNVLRTKPKFRVRELHRRRMRQMTDWKARMDEAMQHARAETDARVASEMQEQKAAEASRLESEAGLLHQRVAKVLEELSEVNECASVFGSDVSVHRSGELGFPGLPKDATHLVSLGLDGLYCDSVAFVVVAVHQKDKDSWMEIRAYTYPENLEDFSVLGASEFLPLSMTEPERIHDEDVQTLATKAGEAIIKLAATHIEEMRMGRSLLR